jgi:hypothetical protein
MPAIGYRSVTIHREQYDVLKSIAKQKDKTITELVEMLIELYSKPYVRAFIDEVASSKEEISSTKFGFEEPFHSFVLDERNVKHYESTSWIRTEDYVKKMRESMLARKMKDRIQDDDEFKIDKIFVISRDSWNKKEVWRWIAEWAYLRFLREKQLNLFFLKEKTADEVLAIEGETDQEKRKCYDMGIYKLGIDLVDPWDTVGYLPINKNSDPGRYKRFRLGEDPEEVKKAERYFDDLKKKAQPIKKLEDIEKLQGQPYD